MNILNKLIEYIKNSYEEFNKVTWPTKKQTKNYTAVVIGLSVAMLVFFSALDFVFEKGIREIIK